MALLRLVDPGFEFDAHVRPICLPEANASLSGCHTAGWGGLEPFESPPEIIAETLQDAAMLELSPERCNERLEEVTGLPPSVDADTMTCAGYLDGTVSVCLVSDIDSSKK